MRFIYTNHGILSEERVQELKEYGFGIEECGIAGMSEDDTVPPPDPRQPGELPGYRPTDSMTDMDEGGPSTRRAVDDAEIWSSIEDLRDDPAELSTQERDFNDEGWLLDGPEEDDQDSPFEDEVQDPGWTEEDEHKWDSFEGKDNDEELQHSQTAFIDAPAPVIGEQDMIEGNPPDMNSLGRESRTMDLVKQVADSMVEAEELRDTIKAELENNPKDYDLKIALQLVDREIAEKKVMIQHLAKKHSSLNEQETGSLSEEDKVFSEEITLLKKIRAGDSLLFKTWPDVLSRMEKEEGIGAKEGIGIIRSMERSLGNLGQDLQLFKDLSRTRKTAAKLLTRNPRLATWIPVELGGKFVG